MATFLNDIFSSPQELAGLHIYKHKDASISYFVCVLKKVKDEIEIQSFNTCSNQEDVLAILDKKLPLVVSLDGLGVLHKKADNIGVQFKQLFPQINSEDFFIQKANFKSKEAYFSVVRQEKLEQELSFLIDNHRFIQSVSLAPFLFQTAYPFIKSNEVVKTVGANIGLNGESVELIPFSDYDFATIQVGDQELPSQYLIAYAAALSYWLKPDYILEGQNQNLSKYFQETVDKRKAVKIAKFSVAIVFILALVNALLYFNIYPKHQELSLEYGAYQNLFLRYNKTSKELKERNELFNASGVSTPKIPKSYIADQLAAVMPSSINLTQLLFNPIDESYKQKERKLRFKERIISIKGESIDALAVNLWISELNKLDWVDKIHASKYKFDAYKNKGAFEFIINVKP